MMRILLVDDDTDLRETLAELLEDEGFRVMHAGNGQEALKALEEERPDVIALDYMMPVMSGGEFRRQQRARADLADIPVLLMTAANDSPDLAAIAATAVVKKPFSLEVLLRCLAEVTSGESGV
jgi:CheY-like chemotaxis protein